MLRKSINVSVTKEQIDNEGAHGAVASAIKATLAPNYQHVEVSADEVRVSGRQFEYVYETPAWLGTLLDAIESDDALVTGFSFTLTGERTKHRLATVY